MKQYQEIMESLDASQQKAAGIHNNAVIAAGAGSGKTRVLAARYIHLIVEKGLKVNEILTLTFTTKAAAEMYSRIHKTLQETDHNNAREALTSFHRAKIQTIDSFCNSVARSACRSFGISPDFSIDAEKTRRLADDLALSFFLEHRASPALAHLIKKTPMADLPKTLFADTMLYHSPITAPLDFASFLTHQNSAIEKLFEQTLDALYETVAQMNALDDNGKTTQEMKKITLSFPERPDITNRTEIITMLRASAAITGIGKRGKAKELLDLHRSSIHPVLCGACNFLLNRSVIEEIFSLLGEFQSIFNDNKREAGLLTFTDVSRMALDALIADPDLRNGFKSEIKAIMIDEFQDDNELQKDLLFLLAENPSRRDKTIPEPEDLCPDKLFFVGDEKQSIYRFRGADVSVFRALSRELGEQDMPRLDTNYRTETPLLEIFNNIFPLIFLSHDPQTGGEPPLYEARFIPINPFQKTDGTAPRAEVLLSVSPEVPDDTDDTETLDLDETEADTIARTIEELITSGYPVRDGESVRPLRYDDIAILFRTGTRQFLYERFLREYGIPCQAEALRGLFNGAPVNDLYALLRLAVFPEDNAAYASLLRSPFVAVSDRAFIQAMLDRTSGDPEKMEPFSQSTAESLESHDRDQFEQGRVLYEEIRAKADRIPAAELISDLWYRLGYRYSLVTDYSSAHFAELYDYFFELARQSDMRNEPIAVFLDSIADIMDSGEKIENLDIPVERTGGVRLMTVHKSKGLEFPVVFLADITNKGGGNRSHGPVYVTGETGVSINTPAPDDCEEAASNLFFEQNREDEQKKTEAELRRLLYVAMTRAETALFITGKIPTRSIKDTDPFTAEGLRDIFTGMIESKAKNAQNSGKRPVCTSFLDLLLPVLAGDPVSGLTVRAVQLREARTADREKGKSPESNPVHRAETGDYDRLDTVPVRIYERDAIPRYTATALKSLEGASSSRVYESKTPDALDRLLKEQDLDPASFGTFAHRAIESRFTGIPAAIPAAVSSAAEEMADRFISSQLGSLAAAASWREAEYSFITRMDVNGKKALVTGQADLVFEHEGSVHVVDYKTDSVENPDEHRAQLAVYRKAVSEIRKKPAYTWLYYLRSGNAVKIDS